MAGMTYAENKLPQGVAADIRNGRPGIEILKRPDIGVEELALLVGCSCPLLMEDCPGTINCRECWAYWLKTGGAYKAEGV